MSTRTTKSLFIGIFLLFLGFSGISQENPMSGFNNLIKGTWLVEGTWENGSKFKQEVKFEWGLDQNIIKTQTFGTIDRASNSYGLRNEGIRAWSAEDSTILFWEFDVYGGITSGTVTFESDNIYYDYKYQGLDLRDAWVFINENEYEFIVSSMKEGNTVQVFQKSKFTRVN